jgi:hypothetical protein
LDRSGRVSDDPTFFPALFQEDYQVPFKFTGTLKRVFIGLTDAKLTAEDEEEIPRAKAAIGSSQ